MSLEAGKWSPEFRNGTFVGGRRNGLRYPARFRFNFWSFLERLDNLATSSDARNYRPSLTLKNGPRDAPVLTLQKLTSICFREFKSPNEALRVL